MSIDTRPATQDAETVPQPGRSRRRRRLHRPKGGPAPALPAFRLPHGLSSGRFVLLVAALLAGGLVALLTVNTSLAAGAIELSGLESSLARQTEQQQALQTEVEGLSSPATLQRAAINLGMVPAAAPVFLDPATGKLSGALAPAPALPKTEAAPQVTPPKPTPKPTPTPTPTPTTRTQTPAPTQPTRSPTTTPLPTPTLAADPGADGAAITWPQARGDRAAPAPTPGATGDSATVVGGRTD